MNQTIGAEVGGFLDLEQALSELNFLESVGLVSLCGLVFWLGLLLVEFLCCSLLADQFFCFSRWVPFVRAKFQKWEYKWENYVRLKQQVHEGEKGRMGASICSWCYFRSHLCYDSFWFHLRLFRVHLRQALAKNATYLGHNRFEVTYSLQGKLYKFQVKPLRGPSSKVRIYAPDRTRDCTDRIGPYLGPCLNWHGAQFTPAFWGETGLEIEYQDVSHFYTAEQILPVLNKETSVAV